MNSVATDYFYDGRDGLRLYAAVYPAAKGAGSGAAVPVLCLPGLTRNSRDFAKLASHLRAGREVIAADLRGRGRSAWDPQPQNYQLMTYVEDVVSLLDARGIARTVVIGTSLGALIGLVLAATRATRIAGVVLNDAGPEIDPAGLRRIASYAGKLPPVSNWAEAAAQARVVYGSALPGLTDAQWLEYARQGYRESASGVPVADMDPHIADAFRAPPSPQADLWPLYAMARAVPLLVVRGAHSDILSAATVERMAREKADLQQVTVANRGHAPLLDEPEALAAIDRFLASIDSAS